MALLTPPANTIPCLSIRQPWAWLIIHAGKDIENRTWATRQRGPLLIHASQKMSGQDYEDAVYFMESEGRLHPALAKLPPAKKLERGGIIGRVDLAGCVIDSPSLWFTGPYGFTLRNPVALPFRAVRGQLGFFNVPLDSVA